MFVETCWNKLLLQPKKKLRIKPNKLINNRLFNFFESLTENSE